MKTAIAAISVCVLSGVAAWADGDLPALKVETLATPVVTARLVSHGLAPNTHGGWNFVGEFMNFKSTGSKEKETIALPTGQHYLAYKDKTIRPEAEWVIADLERNTYKIVDWPGFHSPIPPVLAENGRLFFSVDYGHIYYYDPVEETVKPMARVCDDLNELRCFYKFIPGPDGMVYGSAQATTGLTMLIRINPDTLEYKLYRKVGLPGRRNYLTYGYSLAVDPPWMYVAVGQGNWELFVVNADTGEKKCLADVQGDGTRVTVSQDAEFCSASITGKPKVWLVNGQAVPVVAGQKPQATPINQKKYSRPEWKNSKPMDISKPPMLDPDRPVVVGGNEGDGDIFWRPNGSSGAWNGLHFAIKNCEGVPIESLIALPDGSVLGNTYSYNGFFRYYPATKKLDYFGKHGPSGVESVLYEGKVWFDGYPNVNLSAYDYTQPWTSRDAKPEPQGAPKVNPAFIGFFGQGCTEAHHCRFLLAPGNGRIYICGERERWSTGTGLGYYDIATGKKFGLGTANKEFEPTGCIALPKINRLVLSGNGKTDGKLIIYDLDLNEIERVALKPGLADTGALYNAGADSRFLGVHTDPAAKTLVLYLYDLAAKTVVKSVELAGRAGPVTRRPDDGTFWITVDGVLNRLDPATLELKPVGQFDRGFGNPTWVGNDLYGRNGGDLVRAAVPVK